MYSCAKIPVRFGPAAILPNDSNFCAKHDFDGAFFPLLFLPPFPFFFCYRDISNSISRELTARYAHRAGDFRRAIASDRRSCRLDEFISIVYYERLRGRVIGEWIKSALSAGESASPREIILSGSAGL